MIATSADAAGYIGLTAILLTVVSIIYSVVRNARADKLSTTQRCTERVAELESQITRLRERVATLEDENLHLMRKILAGGWYTKPPNDE